MKKTQPLGIAPDCYDMFQIHHVLQDTEYGAQTMSQALSTILPGIFEPRREKTGFLHMRKQRRRSASR